MTIGANPKSIVYFEINGETNYDVLKSTIILYSLNKWSLVINLNSKP